MKSRLDPLRIAAFALVIGTIVTCIACVTDTPSQDTVRCTEGEKRCGAGCLKISPAVGCGAASCDPCPNQGENSTCINSSCATCPEGTLDCNGDAT